MTVNLSSVGHCCACSRVCMHVGGPWYCGMHDPRATPPAAPMPPTQTGWEAAYWRKQAEFTAETLRTSRLTSEVDRLKAELAEARRTIRSLNDQRDVVDE